MKFRATTPQPFSRPLVVRAFAIIALILASAASARAEEPFQVEVNILSAPIKAGDKIIAHVPRETKLTAHEFNGKYYLVDVPKSNQSQQGWIANSDCHRVLDEWADVKRHLAALPADQRNVEVGRIKAEIQGLADLERRFGELNSGHRWRESLPLARELADRTAMLLGPNTIPTANFITILANRLEDLGEYRSAREYHERALQTRRQLLGNVHADTAASLNNLGVVCADMGDYAAATKYHRDALAIRRAVFGDKHSDTAASLENLGVVYGKIGDCTAARKCFEDGFAICTEVLGETHAATATALNNLGVICDKLGDYTATRKYLENALAIDRRSLGDKNPAIAVTLNGLGGVYMDLGENRLARQCLEQALAIRREVLGEKNAETAASLNDLGKVCDQLGNRSEARKYIESALEIRRAVLGEKHPDTAASLNNLAALCLDSGDYSAARKYTEEALAIRREVLGENNADTANALASLGNVCTVTNALADARRYQEEALKIRNKVLGPTHADTAESLNNLGVVCEMLGEYGASRGYLQRGLAISRQVLGESNDLTARLSQNLAGVEVADGDLAAATNAMQQSRRTARRYTAQNLSALSQQEQLLFMQSADQWAFYRALSMGLDYSENSEIAAASAAWLLNGKAGAEEALAERTRLAHEERSPSSRRQLTALIAIRGRLSTLARNAPPMNMQENWRKEISELDSEEQDLERQLADSGIRAQLVDRWVGVQALRKKLPDDAVIASIVRFVPQSVTAKRRETVVRGPTMSALTEIATALRERQAHYAAWLIPPAGKGDVQIVDLGEAETIDHLVAAARESMRSAGEVLQIEGEAEAERDIQKPLRELAKAVLDPVLAKAGDAKRLILSPDGVLWLAPFAALPLADGKYAIEKYQIDYVVSGRELMGPPGGDNKKIAVNEPVMIANPDFDLAPADVVAETKTTLKEHAAAPGDALAMRDVSQNSLGLIGKVRRLPGTAEEAESIRPHLQKYAAAEPALYTDRRALEGVFKALKSPGVLVLSTHGFFLPDQVVKHDERLEMLGEHRGAVLTVEGKPLENPLLRCGLLLAGCNRRGEATTDDDGVLTGLEIVGTDLRGTELVVLSACDTGLGDIHNGQGVAGLRQAFQLAGARFVVSTLWSISDQKTVPVMSGFFQNLAAGDAHGAALRKAQLALIQSLRKETGAAHPLYWAAFTLTGY